MPEGKTFAEMMRELFPAARMVCYCHRELDACPGNCTNMQVARKQIREWADDGTN